MQQNLEATSAAKLPWDWKDDDCLTALIEALRAEGSSDAIGARLLKRFTGSLTRSAITSGMNREHVLKSIKRLAPDAERLIKVYRQRATSLSTVARVKKQKAVAAERKPPPPRPRPSVPPPSPRVEVPAPVVRRAMTEDEQRQHDAITAYLASTDKRPR